MSVQPVATEAVTRQDGRPPAAKAKSGFERIWKGLDIDSATLDLLPGGTLSPKRSVPDTDRRAELQQLPALALAYASQPGSASQAADLAMGAEIGAGGMGVVQAATQLSLGREVAVKTVRRDVGDQVAAAAELVREARIAGALEHPNVLPIYGLGQDAHGRPMLVMKKVEGTAWRALLERDPPFFAGDDDARTVAERDTALVRHLLVLLQVCNAVAFAHSRNIVHRDLKPENVMVGQFGEVYVLDWGVAVHLDQAEATGTGIAGTPSWMAPEMVAPTPEGIGPRTDVYLLGGLLHALLTGTPRHTGEGLYQVLFNAWNSEPILYPAEVPAMLARLCNAATAHDPADRPADVLAFREQVELFLRNRASLSLADEAQLRLADLQRLIDAVLAEDRPDHLPLDAIGDETAALVHRLGGEARFGFQQALATWPDNPKAIDGYQAVCAAMARFAIAEGDVRTTSHLIGEITDPPEQLVQAWRALSASRVSSAHESERLREIEDDLDFDIGSKWRSRLTLAIGVFWAAVPLLFGCLEKAGLYRVTFPGYVFAGVFFGVFVGALVWFGRHQLMTNRVNRAFVRSLLGAATAPLLQRTLAWEMGLTVQQAMTQDMVVFFLVLLGMAATIDWRLIYGAGIYGVAASVSTVWPSGALFVLAAANLVAMGTVAAVWSPRLAVESRRVRLAKRIQEAHDCIGNAAWRGLKAATAPVARAMPAAVSAVHAVTGRG